MKLQRQRLESGTSDKDSSTSGESSKNKIPDNNKVIKYGDSTDRFDLVLDNGRMTSGEAAIRTFVEMQNNPMKKQEMLEIHLDGPFGAPASNIFKAEHAVLVATGIGVTPFSSILQSIMYRYVAKTCSLL